MDVKILVDECDEGDVFGIRPLLAKRPYVVAAQAMEETLIYAIHTNDFLVFAINFQKREKENFIMEGNKTSHQIIN